MSNYAHYELLHINAYFLNVFKNYLIKSVEGYSGDCFSKCEKIKLEDYFDKLILLEQKNNYPFKGNK